MKLANQHIFVTGGANGIGAAIVRDVALAGAKVSFVDIDVATSESFVKEMCADGNSVTFTRADVGDFAELEHAYNSFVAQFGNVTGVVNNAGVNSYADPVEMTDEQWDAFFAVDLKSIWYTAKLALPAMRVAHKGSIVNIGSIHGHLTYPNFFPYGAAKSAVMGLTRNLGVDEGQHNIRTNTVSPGYVLTSLTRGWLQSEPGREERVLSVQPMERMAEPSEIAKVVTFLLSDDASFVNGSDWPVDGGLSARSA
jgi:NAD(P)-dependent dehydrogenase (short-subunit alcohol dehydrogenase family)